MAKKTKKETTIKANAEATIYIGKPLLGLPQYTIFKEGIIPPHIAEMIKNNEAIKGLIVPVKELQEARKNMHIKGHILNHYYCTINK